MGIPLKTYDLDQVFLTVGGIRITGYGEDDAVTFETASDIIEHAITADGQVVVSRNNDFRVIATITVMETSKSARDLHNMIVAQNAQPAILPLPFLCIDGNSGDQIADQYSAFLNFAPPSKAKAAGTREFRILLPDGARDMLLGATITI